MKQILSLSLFLLMLAGVALAQVDDTVARPAPPSPSLEQLNREAVKSANKARAERNQQNAAMRRSTQAVLYGRKGSVTFDPGVTLFFARIASARQNLCNGFGFNANAELIYHHPLSSKVDITGGIGYRYSRHIFDHDIYFDGMDVRLNPGDGMRSIPSLTSHTVYLPIRMTLVVPSTNPFPKPASVTATEWYIGIAPGLSVASQFSFRHVEADGSVSDNHTTDKVQSRNNFRLDLLLGYDHRWLIFATGLELYFNIIPTFKEGVETTAQIHEFGLRLHL